MSVQLRITPILLSLFLIPCLTTQAQTTPTTAPTETTPAKRGPSKREPSKRSRTAEAKGTDVSVRDYAPVSQLKVPSTDLQHAKMPVVDVHTHFFYRMRHNREALVDFVKTMDRNSIAVCASLDGKLGSQLDEHIQYLWTDYRDRFVIYTNVDWQGDGQKDDPASWACQRPGFAERTAQEIRDAVKLGVSGLKIFKRFGLSYRNPDGTLMQLDDPRWDPIWAVCGELKIPVIIHTADPAAFFEPIDAKNERWEELSRHPNWSFYGDEFPSREELFAARNRVVQRHPDTTFIGAHIANNAEDLATVSRWLEKYPNLVVEIASRISELGRQPYTAREFLIRYADRVLYGTDGPQPESRLRLYWRFLETHDEYFPYSEKSPPPQGFWNIYGVHLPDDVLKKIYHANAARIIPGVRARVEKFAAPQSLEPNPGPSPQ
ncbi:Predicted metal-dependent hydrolase, TIM-barrel fold [Neorhodopirellula lusitana]|uniref:Predicted metal-dependent hydrolase, TIM-barrel fold n=1 Tax=Neorhodopirellula lusitana TaxID=445327 RepID=A0ABY1PS25_9BACT|nr:amidohydrolase family protein [Neorhodopirellula lusitana]SMP37924.1 Predicted metal-dependent hydrolase, TIM-barrel fold [Neorhodopirellula lusitana]